MLCDCVLERWVAFDIVLQHERVFGTAARPHTPRRKRIIVFYSHTPYSCVFFLSALLPQVGVTEIVLAVNYKPEAMMEALSGIGEKVSKARRWPRVPRRMGWWGRVGMGEAQ